ncbi:MAG: sulfatase [Opitutales bacterium]|jgi:iduronate 2-sulfatase
MKLPFLVILSFLLAALQAVASRPNVLFIMTDDLNCNMGAYGHPLVKTPNIDRLADTGIVFDSAFCNYPKCGPSRASFMTGLHPDQNGVMKLRQLFRHYVPTAVTMSQHFRNNGYRVARVGKIYHYDNPNGIGTNGHDDPASWDIRVNPSGRDRAEEDQIFTLKPGNFGGTLSWLAADGTDEEQTDGLVATEAVRLMEQFSGEDKPFFLGVGFYKPHTPYVAPRKYFEMYDPAAIEVPRIPENYISTLPKPAARTLTHKKEQVNLPESTKREAIHAYYATISFLDAQVGRLLEAAREMGLLENTIVLFSSDHGYHMGEHGHFQKDTLFEDADRVPLIISAPSMEVRGTRTSALVEMIDFYRTLSELAGIPEPPSYVQGESLVPVMVDPSASVRDAAITTMGGGYTIRTSRYRYTKWLKTDGLDRELYDRLSDPQEMVNLATDGNYQDVVARMDQLWEAKVAEVRTHPKGLEFIPPKPRDNGVLMKEYLELEREGKLP